MEYKSYEALMLELLQQILDELKEVKKQTTINTTINVSRHTYSAEKLIENITNGVRNSGIKY